MYRYQILVTVAGTVPDPRGETGTFIALLADSGEQKKCRFFLESGNSVVFWGVFACSTVVLVVIVVAIVFFWCGCTFGCGIWLLCIAFGVFRWFFVSFIVFLTFRLIYVGFVVFCLFFLLLLLFFLRFLFFCFPLLLLLLLSLFFCRVLLIFFRSGICIPACPPQTLNSCWVYLCAPTLIYIYTTSRVVSYSSVLTLSFAISLPSTCQKNLRQQSVPPVAYTQAHHMRCNFCIRLSVLIINLQ